MPRKYPPEFRQRAVRLLVEALPDHDSEYEAIRHVAGKLGVSAETLRRRRRVSEVDSGDRPGITSEERAELKRLKRENAELRRANEILRAVSAFSPRSPAAPRRDDRLHRHDAGRFGVEAVCRVLGATECVFITARGYRAANTRPPSARVLSDELLGAEIARLHAQNYGSTGCGRCTR